MYKVEHENQAMQRMYVYKYVRTRTQASERFKGVDAHIRPIA